MFGRLKRKPHFGNGINVAGGHVETGYLVSRKGVRKYRHNLNQLQGVLSVYVSYFLWLRISLISL